MKVFDVLVSVLVTFAVFASCQHLHSREFTCRLPIDGTDYEHSPFFFGCKSLHGVELQEGESLPSHTTDRCFVYFENRLWSPSERVHFEYPSYSECPHQLLEEWKHEIAKGRAEPKNNAFPRHTDVE